MSCPNIIYVFSDQHRSQACGFHGDPNVHTPNMDLLAGSCVEFTMAVSGMPVCCPYRASLLTGQYPHHHGVFLNDLCLMPKYPTMGELFKNAGYDTAYIGKWHLDGHGRSRNVPPERRRGFDYWKVMECTHNYNESYYYSSEPYEDSSASRCESSEPYGGGNASCHSSRETCGDSNASCHSSSEPGKSADQWDQVRLWRGYDAFAQTEDAISYIGSHAAAVNKSGATKPFLLMLSWGPPHDPYDTAPESYKDMYNARKLQLRPNVPENQAAEARQELAGYYAHISALDACLGKLIATVKLNGLWEDTIFIYTSDHGDMLHSQGVCKKQKPWEESIRVPFLLSYPIRFGMVQRGVCRPLNSPDILPTLLDLCGLDIPEYVDGRSLVRYMDENNYIRDMGNGGPALKVDCCSSHELCDFGTEIKLEDDLYPAALLQCIAPNGEWHKFKGGRPYRGIRTRRYTYVRDLNGPWLLYDNIKDPYQMVNLVEMNTLDKELLHRLDEVLDFMLQRAGDTFLPAQAYLEEWGYAVDFLGTKIYEE